MRFDDRLLTVLNQPAGDRHDRRCAGASWSTSSRAPVPTARARSSPRRWNRSASNRPRSRRACAPRLRAGGRRSAVAAGLARMFRVRPAGGFGAGACRGQPRAGQWRALLASADDETRRFVETLHPELARREPDAATEALVERAEPEPHVERGQPRPQRPCRRRRRHLRSATSSRGSSAAAAAASSRPAAVAAAAAPGRRPCSAGNAGRAGDIAWIDGAPRGALIGRSIATAGTRRRGRGRGGRARFRAARAVPRRLLSLPGDGLVSGEWKISGVPAFEPADGRFAGYRGVAMRDLPPPSAQPSVASEVLTDPDSLRELVHEIKTPLECDHRLRRDHRRPVSRPRRSPLSRARGRHRRRGAAAAGRDRRPRFRGENPFGDRAARPPRRPCRTARIACGVAARAGARSAESSSKSCAGRGCRRARSSPSSPTACSIACAWRWSSIRNAASGSGCRSSRAGDYCRFSISRPAALRSVGDEQLFDPRPVAAGEDPALGIGFCAEARARARADCRRRPRRPRRPGSLCWFRAPDLARRRGLSISNRPVRACSSTVEPAAHNG